MNTKLNKFVRPRLTLTTTRIRYSPGGQASVWAGWTSAGAGARHTAQTDEQTPTTNTRRRRRKQRTHSLHSLTDWYPLSVLKSVISRHPIPNHPFLTVSRPLVAHARVQMRQSNSPARGWTDEGRRCYKPSITAITQHTRCPGPGIHQFFESYGYSFHAYLVRVALNDILLVIRIYCYCFAISLPHIPHASQLSVAVENDARGPLPLSRLSM